MIHLGNSNIKTYHISKINLGICDALWALVIGDRWCWGSHSWSPPGMEPPRISLLYFFIFVTLYLSNSNTNTNTGKSSWSESPPRMEYATIVPTGICFCVISSHAKRGTSNPLSHVKRYAVMRFHHMRKLPKMPINAVVGVNKDSCECKLGQWHIYFFY